MKTEAKWELCLDLKSNKLQNDGSSLQGLKIEKWKEQAGRGQKLPAEGKNNFGNAGKTETANNSGYKKEKISRYEAHINLMDFKIEPDKMWDLKAEPNKKIEHSTLDIP